MLKFDGPHFESSPHARFLYKSFSVDQTDLSVVYKVIMELDEFITKSPRIHKAHENIYIYFFGPEAKEFWVGREITGFIPKSITEFKVFDSYRGEVLTWNILGSITAQREELKQWILHSEQLRSLAGEALAMTWRVKIGPLEMISDGQALKSPHISFQFFKTH